MQGFPERPWVSRNREGEGLGFSLARTVTSNKFRGTILSAQACSFYRVYATGTGLAKRTLDLGRVGPAQYDCLTSSLAELKRPSSRLDHPAKA
jgi:hypothetical protein